MALMYPDWIPACWQGMAVNVHPRMHHERQTGGPAYFVRSKLAVYQMAYVSPYNEASESLCYKAIRTYHPRIA
jgi:hypothetical protein